MNSGFATPPHIDDTQVAIALPYAFALSQTHRLLPNQTVTAAFAGLAPIDHGCKFVAVSGKHCGHWRCKVSASAAEIEKLTVCSDWPKRQ
jgi:hypothetical protein